jgi:single-strand DNA-binding protein
MANLSYNKVILGGRLTATPELKSTQSGTKVTSFSIAVNRRGAKDGEQTADFINCVAWKERAELICKFFVKGSSILVEGELQTRKWKDNQGNDRNATEVIVSQVHFVDSKNESPTATTYAGNSVSSATPSYAPVAKPPQFEDYGSDDSLPF